MKKYLAFALAGLMLAVSPVVFTACHTPTQQKVTVNTMFTLHKTVDAALDGYINLVITGKVPTNGLTKVTAAYNQFQSAFNVAVAFVASHTNAVIPQTVADAAANVSSTITAAKEGK